MSIQFSKIHFFVFLCFSFNFHRADEADMAIAIPPRRRVTSQSSCAAAWCSLRRAGLLLRKHYCWRASRGIRYVKRVALTCCPIARTDETTHRYVWCLPGRFCLNENGILAANNRLHHPHTTQISRGSPSPHLTGSATAVRTAILNWKNTMHPEQWIFL